MARRSGTLPGECSSLPLWHRKLPGLGLPWPAPRCPGFWTGTSNGQNNGGIRIHSHVMTTLTQPHEIKIVFPVDSRFPNSCIFQDGKIYLCSKSNRFTFQRQCQNKWQDFRRVFQYLLIFVANIWWMDTDILIQKAVRTRLPSAKEATVDLSNLLTFFY